jgi:transcriptional regulator with XRE-family HTH domain
VQRRFSAAQPAADNREGGSMRKKSKRRTLSNHSKPTLDPRSAGNVDIEMGRRIRLRRVEIGLSQSELGEKLGVSFQQVQKYEKGVNRVGASRLQQIAEALGVDLTFFYEGNSKAEREVDSLLFLDSSFSLRLLRAYTAVENQAVQRQFVSLVESIVASQD